MEANLVAYFWYGPHKNDKTSTDLKKIVHLYTNTVQLNTNCVHMYDSEGLRVSNNSKRLVTF